ncbi:MAG TPA: hypothetical protein VKP69_30935 [Isosphaeraceae bacterium]|nr:hypothetical protein [Isosphaeraceae bacterium]
MAVLSVLVSIGLLALVVRRVEIREAWRHLRRFDPRWLIFSTSTLEMFGIAPARALALTLVIHAWVYAVIIGVGLLASLARGVGRGRAASPSGCSAGPGLVAISPQFCEIERCRITES